MLKTPITSAFNTDRELAIKLSNKILGYMNKSPSPYHCCATARNIFLQNGYTELPEETSWNVSPGNKYFLIRDNSTYVAFTVGKKWNPKSSTFKLVGTHVDSPNFRLAPKSLGTSKEWIQCHIQIYGGPSAFTWYDRDLKLAGRVLVKKGDI
jgi:aspartyl aminopeptidase